MSIARLMQMGAAASTGPEGAWDLSYAYFTPNSWDISNPIYLHTFSVASQETNPQGLFFKPDGTKMYVVGLLNDAVYEYDLSTAWDITTASYLRNFSVASQDGNPSDLFFKPDGTKMYVVGQANDAVYEYDLSTAWNVSTASYLQNFSVASQEITPQGLFFKPDGTKMYVIGSAGVDVNEYDLSTAWDVSTASYLQNFSVSAQETSPTGLFFKPDGTKMYVVGFALDVSEYDLSTAWDVSSASYLQDFYLFYESFPTGVFFKPDGTRMYVVGRGGDNVYEYFLPVSFNIFSQESNPTGVFFKFDGTKMYVVGTSGDDVNEYDLSTAWDVKTASYLQNFSFGGLGEGTPNDVFFKPDGTKMYILGDGYNAVLEFDLSTAWDVSSASYLQLFSVSNQETNPTGVFFKPDGTKMYVVGYAGDNVNEYDLSTAWDVSSASYLQNFSISAQETLPTGLFFKPDGTKMYVVGTANDNVNEYDLSTAWDVSTASYLQSFDAEIALPKGLFFRDDGLQMFIVNGDNLLWQSVISYTLGPQ